MGRPVLSTFFVPDQLNASMGRVLLLLASILLVALPFTQYIWTWDGFLRGGHDFETNSLLILSVLCLVLVLVQCCRQRINLLLASLPSVLRFLPRPLPQPAGRAFVFSADTALARSRGTFNRPLLV
jgi:hypothetical protein